MAYGKLAWITLRGLVVIAIVGWLMLLIRDNFVYGEPHLPWGVFIALVGGAMGAAFGLGAQSCLRAIRDTKGARAKKVEGVS